DIVKDCRGIDNLRIQSQPDLKTADPGNPSHIQQMSHLVPAEDPLLFQLLQPPVILLIHRMIPNGIDSVHTGPLCIRSIDTALTRYIDSVHQTCLPIMRKNRSSRAGSVSNTPLLASVTVWLPGFLIPRMVMHICSASIMTMAPFGCMCSISASAICPVSCSWICSLLANTSTVLASLLSPTTFPSGI